MPEILLYGPINDISAAEFISALAQSRGAITVCVNTGGGDPESMFGMVHQFSKYPGPKTVEVHGKAYSAGTFMLPYVDDATALDVSQFLIHRAAYSAWFEKSDYMTQAMWDNLDKINKFLRSGLEAKIDVAKFEALKKITLDEVFSNEGRVDVFLTADEAKKIGLISNIVKITPQKQARLNAFFQGVAAEYVPYASSKEGDENTPKKITKNMNIEELKTNHPELYKQVYDAGVKAGTESEQDRVGAWIEFVDDDAEAVKAGIQEGKKISQTEMAKFAKASMLKQAAAANAPEAGQGPEAGGGAKSEEEKKKEAAQAFEDEADKALGLGKKD